MATYVTLEKIASSWAVVSIVRDSARYHAGRVGFIFTDDQKARISAAAVAGARFFR